MHGCGVVDAGRDPGFAQPRLYGGTICDAQHVLVEHVRRPRAPRRAECGRERRVVLRRNRLPARVMRVEMREFHPQNGRLDLVEP